MIRSSEPPRFFQRWYARERVSKLSYDDALGIFTALWNEARELDPEFPGDWRHDIRPDLAVARALNGLPPPA